MVNNVNQDTITAIATGQGGAISIIRVSGSESINIVDKIFHSRSKKKLIDCEGFSLHYGDIKGSEGEQIDDVIVSLFRSPHSYTGENSIEISCHASSYIQESIIKLLVNSGCRIADAGEFTMRAYLNGKMDLVQAESVADVISSNSSSSHRLAVNQMRGGYSKEFTILRSDLIHIMSLLELELDFGEEDVEFADRTELLSLLSTLASKIHKLTSSFARGNAIKNGVPIAIIGKPNVGKSTLLNALLKDDRAIVSDIAGTTRDVIEESINIGGINFRFIDTAGIRDTDDTIESQGIERTFRAKDGASLVLYITDSDSESDINEEVNGLQLSDWQKLFVVVNKCDKRGFEVQHVIKNEINWIYISAKNNDGIDLIEDVIGVTYSDNEDCNEVLISNMRHYELLSQAEQSTSRAINGIENGLPTDLISHDIRETSHHLGLLTGEINTDDVLGSIFSNFCIGK